MKKVVKKYFCTCTGAVLSSSRISFFGWLVDEPVSLGRTRAALRHRMKLLAVSLLLHAVVVFEHDQP